MTQKRTLLLNNNYEVLGFIPERKTFILLWKDKVEVISNWDDEVNWGTTKINHPAVIRLINLIKRRKYFNITFSKKLLFKRDNYQCLYCYKPLTDSQVTIDHVIPKYLGGKTSFTNCVTSCKECNNKKGNKTLEQAGMVLIKHPNYPPHMVGYNIPSYYEHWHQDWDYFVSNH
jgi:hypothetical protein